MREVYKDTVVVARHAGLEEGIQGQALLLEEAASWLLKFGYFRADDLEWTYLIIAR